MTKEIFTVQSAISCVVPSWYYIVLRYVTHFWQIQQIYIRMQSGEHINGKNFSQSIDTMNLAMNAPSVLQILSLT